MNPETVSDLVAIYFEYRRSGNAGFLEDLCKKIDFERDNLEGLILDVAEIDLAIQKEIDSSVEGSAVSMSNVTQSAIRSFRRPSPIQRLYHIINRVDQWANDERSTEKAYIMACLSELAYAHLAKQELPGRDRYKLFQPSSIQKRLFDSSLNVELASVLKQFDLDCTILEIGRFVYVVAFVGSRFVAVAVRGTTQLSDWLFINANFFLTRGMKDGYHPGFHEESCTALPKLQRLFVARDVSSTVPIYFTGHSLGAAVAGILAKIWPGPVMLPYLFASPRFASGQLAQRRPPHAYVTPEDLVPHLPFQSFGFADASEPLQVMPSGQKQLSVVQSLKQYHSFTDLEVLHKIERYRRLLGLEIHEDFGETVYMDSLIEEIKKSG